MTTTSEATNTSSTDCTEMGLEHFDNEDGEELGFGLFDAIPTKVITNSSRKQFDGEKIIKLIDLDEFLTKHYDNKIVKVHKENFDNMKLPLIVSFHNFDNNCRCFKSWTDKLYEETLRCKDKIQFTVADYADINILNLGRDIYLPKHDFVCHDKPETYAIDEENRIYYHVRGLSDFCEKLQRGKLFFSEPLPLVNDELVKVAVACNFDALIAETDKDIFINFYAPWCPFSKELLQHLNKMAELLKDENLLIVKMDAEANYVPVRYNVFAYPKSFIIPKMRKNKFLEYNCGPRTFENLIKFVAANVTDELKTYDREGCLRS